MDLEPGEYPCPTHGEDLESLVRVELEMRPETLAAAGPRRLAPVKRRKSFLVLVPCPRDGGHDVEFRGMFR